VGRGRAGARGRPGAGRGYGIRGRGGRGHRDPHREPAQDPFVRMRYWAGPLARVSVAECVWPDWSRQVMLTRFPGW